MYSPNDISGVHSLLNSTGEGNLRKMMVDAQFTEAHLRLLIKLAKGCPEADFIEAFNKEGFGTIKTTPAENKMKETFWGVCKAKLSAMGLLGLTTAKAA